MKTKVWLDQATRQLKQAGIGTARLDSLVLLEDICNKDRSWLLAHPEYEIKDAAKTKLDEYLTKRGSHVPLAYVLGKTEFYGREFIISKSVLEPRPESETMIDLLKNLPLPKKIIDIGTGSGALAIIAKLEMSKTEVIATDIDSKCLEVAQKNAQKHKVKVQFLKGDLLKPLSKSEVLDSVILANLPYVPDSYTINKAALQEPRSAIFGGKDGLNVYRQLFMQIAKSLQKPSYVLTESLPFQHKKLTKIAQKYDFCEIRVKDFIQLFIPRDSLLKRP